MCVSMGKHTSDLEGVFEKAFAVLEIGDQSGAGSKQWKSVLGLVVQNTSG